MANLTVAAGTTSEVNGVAGVNAELVGETITGTLAGANFTASGDVAIRHSVAQTAFGANQAGTASEVYSVTQGFRTAYVGVEADSPEVTRV